MYDPTEHGGILWSPGVHDGIDFFSGELDITLGVIGITTLPPLLYISANWIVKGNFSNTSTPEKNQFKKKIITIFFILSSVLFISLGLALTGVILIHLFTFLLGISSLGVLMGVLSTAGIISVLLLRNKFPIKRFLSKHLYIS